MVCFHGPIRFYAVTSVIIAEVAGVVMVLGLSSERYRVPAKEAAARKTRVNLVSTFL